MGGLNLLNNAYTSNNSSIIVMLKPWEERTSKEEQLKPILMSMTKKFAAYPEAVTLVFPPPPITAWATPAVSSSSCRTGGKIASRTPLHQDERSCPAPAESKFTRFFPPPGYRTTIPQIKLDIDPPTRRARSTSHQLVLFQGLQIYLGGFAGQGFYTLFDAPTKVMLQAEQDFRKSPRTNDIYLRANNGNMVRCHHQFATIDEWADPPALHMFRTPKSMAATPPASPRARR